MGPCGFLSSEVQAGDLIMPYASNAELPSSVRSHLPQHAQDIFRTAFNHAFESHRNDPRHEEIAHRIAWSAVKRRYKKEGSSWAQRKGPDD
jgi:cation transport regulator